MAPAQLVDSSGSDSDSDREQNDNLAFKVNAAFAEKYEAKKRGEELSKRAYGATIRGRSPRLTRIPRP